MFDFGNRRPGGNWTLTKTLIAINVAVFGLMLLFPGAVRYFALIPADFQPWQLLTATFMHGGPLHLFVNMLGIWSIGEPIERDVGRKRFALLYLASALAGSLVVLMLQWGEPTATVGASGALLGLVGALGLLYPNARLIILIFPVRARTAAIGIGLISLALVIFNPGAMGISHTGHLGGLLGGLAYSWFALRHVRRPTRPSAFGPTSHSQTADDAELLAEFLRRQRNYTGRGHIIRDVNPPPPTQRGDSHQAPGQGSPDGGAEKKLYFDPQSGRFFFG